MVRKELLRRRSIIAEDAYWNVADPGWAYGLYYAVVGPLLLGHTTTFYEGPFTVESTYRVLEKYHITNLAAAPSQRPTACSSQRVRRRPRG